MSHNTHEGIAMDTFTATMNQIQADLDRAVAVFEAVVTERMDVVIGEALAALGELASLTV